MKTTPLRSVCMIMCFTAGSGVVASGLPVYAGTDTAHAVWVKNGMVSSQERVATDVGVAGLSMVAVGTDLYCPWYATVGSLLTWLSARVIQLFTHGIRKKG